MESQEKVEEAEDEIGRVFWKRWVGDGECYEWRGNVIGLDRSRWREMERNWRERGSEEGFEVDGGEGREGGIRDRSCLIGLIELNIFAPPVICMFIHSILILYSSAQVQFRL